MQKNRRIILILGIILIIFGILVAVFPQSLRVIFSLVLGISLLFSWIAGIVTAISNKWLQFPGITLAVGILNTILGILLLVSYGATFLQTLFSWMIAIWALIRWAILLMDALQDKKNNFSYRWLDIIVAIGLLILAVLLIINPFGGASVITILFGLSVIWEGIAMTIFSYKLKKMQTLHVDIQIEE